MGLRIKQTLWIERMRKEHPCFQKFIKVPSSPKSKESYAYKIQRFMKFAAKFKYVKHEEDFESLLDYDSEKITDILEEFVNYLESQGLVYEAIKPTLAAPELFFEMNRKLWHKKLVRRSMQKEDRIQGGREPVTHEDLKLMLKYCGGSARKEAVIHFLASTGIRPYALVDPVLKIKHLKSMPNPDDQINHPDYCYAVKVYDESREGYFAFLTPEARKAIDRYLNGRKLQGEKLDDETPLFTTLGCKWNTKSQHLTDDNMKEIVRKIIKGAQITRKKIGNRYDKSLIYMFRKRFNTILKLNNHVNSNIAEKLMAHKKGLDGTYLQPTLEECYREFVKAIPELTISDEFRLQLENALLKNESQKLPDRNIIKRLEKRIEDLELGKEARDALYAKGILNAKGDLQKALSLVRPLIIEFPFSEEVKRKFMREIIDSKTENRSINPASFIPDYENGKQEIQKIAQNMAQYIHERSKIKQEKPAYKVPTIDLNRLQELLIRT